MHRLKQHSVSLKFDKCSVVVPGVYSDAICDLTDLMPSQSESTRDQPRQNRIAAFTVNAKIERPADSSDTYFVWALTFAHLSFWAAAIFFRADADIVPSWAYW